jgi:hypothetical protein
MAGKVQFARNPRTGYPFREGDYRLLVSGVMTPIYVFSIEEAIRNYEYITQNMDPALKKPEMALEEYKGKIGTWVEWVDEEGDPIMTCKQRMERMVESYAFKVHDAYTWTMIEDYDEQDEFKFLVVEPMDKGWVVTYFEIDLTSMDEKRLNEVRRKLRLDQFGDFRWDVNLVTALNVAGTNAGKPVFGEMAEDAQELVELIDRAGFPLKMAESIINEHPDNYKKIEIGGPVPGKDPLENGDADKMNAEQMGEVFFHIYTKPEISEDDRINLKVMMQGITLFNLVDFKRGFLEARSSQARVPFSYIDGEQYFAKAINTLTKI